MLELKIHLIKNGITQLDLARQLGISPQYMSDVVKGRRKAPHIRQRLIALGMPAKLPSRPKKSFSRKHCQAA